VIIELSENIGVKNIKKFYSDLMDGMKKDTEIILDLGKVRRIDLSFAQVIMAANRDYGKKGKQIKLRSVSNKIKKQLYMSGFSI
jgi:anti-anti-sigma regulatory factor